MHWLLVKYECMCIQQQKLGVRRTVGADCPCVGYPEKLRGATIFLLSVSVGDWISTGLLLQLARRGRSNYTEWATKKQPAFCFARVLVKFSLALVCILRIVFEQSVNSRVVNSRAVTILRYTRCNIVILMAATAWLMLSFSSCIVCGFDSRYTNQIRTRYRN